MSNSALPPQDKEMSLVQHLLELRNAVTKSVIAVLVMFLCLFPFANEIYTYIADPLTRYLPEGQNMLAVGVISPFLTPFKLSFVLAIYLAMPFLLYQLWKFIAPALYQHEKTLVAPVLFFSSFLFYAGGAFSYYVVFPLVFGFISQTAPEGVTVATDIALYLDFVIKMFFAFGMAFEVPVVTALLIISGIVKPEKLTHARPYVIVGAFVLGMLLTPPDVISQTLLAIPVWLLYEVGVVVGTQVRKRRSKDLAAFDEQNADIHANHEDEAATTRSGSTDDEGFDNRYAEQNADVNPHQTADKQAEAAKKEDDFDFDAEFDKIEAEMNELTGTKESETDSKQSDKPKKSADETSTDEPKK